MGTRSLRLSILCLAVGVSAVATAAASADPGGSPAGGAFVIGDQNASSGSAVDFWGAQWWQDNQLSGGTAPASFKGYTVTVDPFNCTFTTAPGDSSSPPSGPLPSTMSVIIASSVAKSGPTITGTIAGFATVSTDPGYAPDPGHAGTGTFITSFESCGGDQ